LSGLFKRPNMARSMKKAGVSAGLFLGNRGETQRFIARSQNKPEGTGDIREPRPCPFVVGAGNDNT
jgi:hypothetical protein